MAKCSFCDTIIKAGRGKISITKEGRAMSLCSSKCEKNFKLGRNPKKMKWITKRKDKKAEKKEAGKKA